MRKIRVSVVGSMGLAGLLSLALLSGCNTKRTVTAPKESVYRVAMVAKVPTLDPQAAPDLYSHVVASLAYEQLYYYNYLKRPFELEPVLAESLPVFSKDRKTMTIKIKKGIKFHDDECFPGGKGREVNAEDVSFMFHRIAAPKFTSRIYGAYEGNVVGIDDYHKGKAPKISGIKVLDSHTIEIKLTRALPRIVYQFTDGSTAIVPKEAVEKYGERIRDHVVGTGPFKYAGGNLHQKMTFVKNPDYNTMTYPTEGKSGDREKGLLDDAGKKLPLLDKVVIEVIVESQPRWLKFMAGELEQLGIPKDNMGQALPGGKLSDELAARGVQHFREPRSDITVTTFNMRDPVWGKKKELRQAFALAKDVSKFIEIQYAGQAIPAQSLLDPMQYPYDPNYRSRWSTRNVEKAKELIAKAGYPGGKGLPPLEYLTMPDTTYRQHDELLQRHLSEVGITLKLEAMTWPEMMERAHKHNFTAYGIGYASSTPDFDDAASIMTTKGIESGQNGAAYSNPEVDRLITEIEGMDNGEPRKKKIRRVLDIMEEDLPYVPAVHRIGNQLLQPWVKNHVYSDEAQLGHWMKYKKVVPAQ